MTGPALDPLVVATAKKRGFTRLSVVQEQAIPPVLAGKNLLLIAPTGTGKTESAMLPVFSKMMEETGSGFRALYITPLRSLNRDMLQRLEWWCKELGLRAGVRHGDTSALDRRKQTLSPPDLLITTPETLQALYMGKRIRQHLRNVRHVIIDEVHELAGSKRGAQLSVALERLYEYAGDFQRIGLSATVGNPEEVARFLCSSRPCEIVQVPVAKSLDISVKFIGDDFKHQTKVLDKMLPAHESTLVFVNTRVTAEALGHALYERGDVEVHHGSLSKDVRIDAEDRFKKGDLNALICTSSMELGIDIGQVSHVIQFGSPRVVARLVQRVGRAGHRLNTVSKGTVLATSFDDILESVVIARRAKAGEIERVIPHYHAADVLANQVAALAVEYGEIHAAKVRSIISRSEIFRETPDLIDSVISQVAEHRLIRMDGEKIVTTLRARKYLAATLSMIHDERKIPIYDIISRKTVGTLDESFVVAWIHTGVIFITKGQLWRVLDIEEGRLKVEPAKKAQGELPSWEGEQIPVPYEIAQEVGRLRASRDIGTYTKDRDSQEFATHFLTEMDKNRSPIATDRQIVLENAEEGVICNICAGNKANEALGRALSILLSARFGTTVGLELDAYRVFLRLPTNVRAADIRDTLLGIDPTHLEGILSLALKRTSLYKWKLIQVAKKFGAVDPDADYERISLSRLAELFEGTVVQKETYRELFSIYMDVGSAAEVVRSIRDGETSVLIAQVSILGAAGLFSSKDQIPPPSADKAVIATLKKRLDEDDVVLGCMHCRKWKSRTQVSRVPDRPKCPLCGAGLIAAVKPWDEPHFALAAKKQKNDEEKEIEKRLLRNANIVLSSGKKAVIALAARGVGPENASRIIGSYADGDAFYREILKAERNFVKTHRFWQQ